MKTSLETVKKNEVFELENAEDDKEDSMQQQGTALEPTSNSRTNRMVTFEDKGNYEEGIE